MRGVSPLPDSLEALFAASPSLATRLGGLARAAASDAPILILGEPGTGRSTLARTIHRASGRRGGPLLEMDLGVIPPTLFESELFGHEAGAFTGAETATSGRIVRAEGGTLVLDHVEELPLAAQPKLLRVLAEGRFAPLGGRERPASVRFLAIGPEDLADRVDRGAFRDDLYYRLEVLAFRLPPLRSRPGDMAAICDHLLAELGGRFGRSGLRLHAGSREWIEEYHWPGNLRQLRNVLERTLVISPGEELRPEPPGDAGEARPRSLAEMEREHLLTTLAYTRGHQGRAAELLGISRKALWEKRKRYGIP